MSSSIKTIYLSNGYSISTVSDTINGKQTVYIRYHGKEVATAQVTPEALAKLSVKKRAKS
jgi:hypothetical protein